MDPCRLSKLQSVTEFESHTHVECAWDGEIGAASIGGCLRCLWSEGKLGVTCQTSLVVEPPDGLVPARLKPGYATRA